MSTIQALLDAVRQINLREEVPKIIEQTSYEITALNQQQLYSGLDSKGNKIGKYKSNSYATKKSAKNSKPGFGVPDLFVTGTFYKGMGVVVKGDTFENNSVDIKTSKLIEEYGEGIFGLTDESKAEYAQNTLFEGIKKYITSKTGLK